MDSFLQAHIQGIADDGMTYRNLGRPRDGPYEIFEIHEAQVVARIDIQTAFSRTFSRHHIRPHRILAAALVT